MIIKSFELDKIDLEINKIFLLYGENQGAKDELIQSIINQKKIPTFKYHENEVINNSEDFFNSILSKSFFDKEKIFIESQQSLRQRAVILDTLPWPLSHRRYIVPA